MGYVVQGRIEVSIFINDVEYPLDPGGNTLNFLHVGVTTKGRLPTCHMALTDTLHSLDKLNLQDAIPIRVAVKALTGTTKTYFFRKFHHTKEFNGSAYQYSFDGYWDSIKFWTGTSIATIRGTSDDVLQNIATACGLSYDGVPTNDSQLWVPRNRSYGEFVNSVQSRGYIDQTSYMVAAVDLTGTLRYRNVNDLPDPTRTVIAHNLSTTAFTAMDFRPVAKSGLGNKLTGYWNTRHSQSMTGATLSTPNDQLAFTPDVRSPLFNTAAKTESARGYQTYAAIDVGNVHGNYERAVYQNQRFANLFSLEVEFLMYTPTNFTLFDKFTFAVDAESQKQDLAYGGVYTIAGFSFLVQGATYAEKLLGVRHGTNSMYTSG